MQWCSVGAAAATAVILDGAVRQEDWGCASVVCGTGRAALQQGRLWRQQAMVEQGFSSGTTFEGTDKW